MAGKASGCDQGVGFQVLQQTQVVVKEREHFDRLWSIIERAVDLGVVSSALENEFRLLNQVRAPALELPDDSYGDLNDLISAKLSALLRKLLADLLPESDVPIAPALDAAAVDAPHEIQLAALDEGLQATADQLELVAEEVTARAAAAGDDVVPYLREPLEWAVSTAERIGATLRRIDDAFRALTGTKTGRQLARLGYVATRSAGSASLVMAASHADVPHVGNAHAATVAVISAVVGNWLYSRRRRADPSLPAVEALREQAQPAFDEPESQQPG